MDSLLLPLPENCGFRPHAIGIQTASLPHSPILPSPNYRGCLTSHPAYPSGLRSARSAPLSDDSFARIVRLALRLEFYHSSLCAESRTKLERRTRGTTGSGLLESVVGLPVRLRGCVTGGPTTGAVGELQCRGKEEGTNETGRSPNPKRNVTRQIKWRPIHLVAPHLPHHPPPPDYSISRTTWHPHQ